MLVHEILKRGKDNNDAIYSQLGALTYQGLRVATENCRRRLYAMGVRQRSTVGIYSRNRAEYIAAYMAIVSLGAIVVPINFQLSMRETAFILKNADSHFLLTDKPLTLDAAINSQYYEDVKQMDIGTCIEPTTLPPPPELPKDFSPDEPAALIYTSGTTGEPKGAVLSHRNLVMNTIDLQQVVHYNSSDNVLCVLPMYHCFAWTCAVMISLYTGATLSIQDAFTPKKTIDITRALGVTIIVMVPSICSLITKLATPEDFKTLRFVMLGGTTLPEAIGTAFTTKFNIPIVEGYGLSEASPVVTMNPPEATRATSVGPAIPDVKIRIVNPETGLDVPQGERGELLVQGPNVMHGYWKNEEATATTLADGWLHTGDVARCDEDGYYYIVDRIKDMIISMGENIYPREIEELIYAFPGIREVAVVPVADKLRGQAGSCYYTVQPDTEVDLRALKKYLQQNLALFKIPREFHEIKEMPKTATGKIAKKELFELNEESV
ncbi:MAG: AMP-binding protein [Schwartzia sp.]|nr:AMP-binding protein [Schwartzia sp. (in: firmicutes)]